MANLLRALSVVALLLLAVPQATQSQSFDIVESIPQGLTINPHRRSTYSAWMEMLQSATQEIDIACFYMTLTGGVPAAGGNEGQNVYNAIIDAAKRGVNVNIVTTYPSKSYPQTDALNLAKNGFATVRFINFDKIFGSGILHTKMVLVDNTSFYVGSANIDWRSLTQVKELGAFGEQQPSMTQELWKIFQVYWIIGQNSTIPSSWPPYLQGITSRDNPMTFQMNTSTAKVSFSMAPPAFSPPGWTMDDKAITGEMIRAADTIDIEVMTYYPAILYAHPTRYWGVIDETIRRVQYDNTTRVRILIGHWAHSIPTQIDYLRSLNALPQVHVRFFIVPAGPIIIPYTRVNHAKWMVTDKSVYIGTSNWSGDYFTDTAGVGLVLQSDELRTLGQKIFDRDWNSQYSVPLPPV